MRYVTTKDWIKDVRHFLPANLGKILEIGSRTMNKEGVRSLFSPTEFESWTGIDMQMGQNVDVVLNAHNLVDKFGLNSFDIVINFSELEHDDAFWVTQEQTNKVLKKGGYYIVEVPSIKFYHHHNYPSDYWRFTGEAVKYILYKEYRIISVTSLPPATRMLIVALGEKL
jgi:predicted SAM-dependent methyltransferase